jgi:hypothetical protein
MFQNILHIIGYILLCIGVIIFGAGLVNLILNFFREEKDKQAFSSCCVMYLISAVLTALGSFLSGLWP